MTFPRSLSRHFLARPRLSLCGRGAVAAVLCAAAAAYGQSSPAPAQTPTGSLPFSISVYDRTRAEGWQWFAAPPETETYGYLESLVRIGIAQKIHKFDWQLELTQPALLDLPTTAISPVAAQGQLGLGGTYYASNGSNAYPAAAALKQGFLRYHFAGAHTTIRAGRFEFFDGQETQPKDATLAWLQTNRVAQRLIGNFGFSNAQRSFDGVDAHLGDDRWDLTAMAARADQGVYNMNANPELNVDLQYLAVSHSELKQHMLWRIFGMDYHDGRPGIVKTDNRPLAVRQADHKNIRLGTFGGDLLAVVPAGIGQFDFVAWAALQDGNWGVQHHSAQAAAGELGFKLPQVTTAPWLRAGYFRSTGDGTAGDNQHNTFFQVLPTPRVYARFPFFNLMNSTDEYVQLIDKPAKQLDLRADLHGLQLSSKRDLWYLGGGAFDSKVFGFTGRTANARSSFASFADMSADWQASREVALNFYYAHAWGRSVVRAIYPTDRTAQFGYVEMVYRWGLAQKASAQ